MCLNGFVGLKRMTELCKTRLPEGFVVAVYDFGDLGYGRFCTWLRRGDL